MWISTFIARRWEWYFSILLYSILRDWLNMDSKPHEISLKKLREQLGAMEASYDVYKNLRKRVLDVADMSVPGPKQEGLRVAFTKLGLI